MKEETSQKCADCFLYVKNIGTFLVSHIGLVSMVVGYCLIGALTFEALEKRHETEVKQDMIWKRRNITQKVWDTTHKVPYLQKNNWTGEVATILKEFETDLLTAMRRDGWDGTEDFASHQWTFSGSLFYSIIVITTIGYGHIAPKTQWGKIVTIFYAILGIPLMLLCLSNIGDGLAQSFRFLYWKVCCYACERQPKKKPPRNFVRSFSARVDGKHGNLKRYLRYSRRSADSAISDSALGRSSFSASEWDYRGPARQYYDDMDIALAGNRERLSDSRKQPDLYAPQNKFRNYTYPRTVSRPKTTYLRHEEEEAAKVPVLCNKYAIDSQEDFLKIGNNIGSEYKKKEQFLKGNETVQMNKWVKEGQCEAKTEWDATKTLKNQWQKRNKKFDVVYSTNDYFLDHDDFYYEPRTVPIWLCVVLVISYILGGAFLFTNWEKWSYLDSAYFCFITLTTIGFGDFVPAQNTKDNPEVSIALCSLYLLFGIALLAMSFNLVQEEVITSVKLVAKKLGIIKDDDDEVSDED